MSKIKHSYDGQREDDNRITDDQSLQELEAIAAEMRHSVFTSGDFLYVSGHGSLGMFEVSDNGVHQALKALSNKSN